MQNLMIEDGFEEDIVVPEDVNGREILSYITPSVLIIEFHVECECDWEEEHGLEITIKDNKLVYVGSFDGMPPYYEERLAYVGYYDKENLLLESVKRCPTNQTLWMINRIINDPKLADRDTYMSVLADVAARDDIAPEVKADAQHFLEFQNSK